MTTPKEMCDMGKLTDKLKGDRTKVLSSSRGKVLWDGPSSSTDNGGITFSMLSRFLCCRERFRIQVVEGLKPKAVFNPSIEYGSWWHVAEEEYAKGSNSDYTWAQVVEKYGRELDNKYPASRDEINHWYKILLVQFPEYIKFWSKHSDVVKEVVLEQEQVFNVLYKLPSGRIVYLKGKRDKVSLIDDGIWLQENKTKSTIDQYKIGRQLTFDLQTQLYLVGLQLDCDNLKIKDSRGFPLSKKSVKGVRYNVIRRSAHKSSESMYKKMTEDIEAGRGGEWFSRWNVEITTQDIEYFKVRTLNPILEQLCDWWEWVLPCNDLGEDGFTSPKGEDFRVQSIHWQAPFGVYDIIKEGGSSDLDNYISSGSEVGLERATTLFPELE